MRRLRALLAAALLTVALVACASGAPTASAPTASAPTASAPAAHSMEAQRDPPSGMPPPVLAEDCRSLTGILPVSPTDLDPYGNTWAFALRYALAVDQPDAFASVGIRVDEVVVYPVAHDVEGTRQVVDAATDGLAAAGFTVGQWRLGEPRSWTFTDLCSTFELLLAADSPDIVGHGPTDDGHMEVWVPDERARSSPILADIEARRPGMLLVTLQVGEIVAEVGGG
ncbi:hypothetical protein ACVWW9_002829 [Agrococcus sp. UYP33]